MSSEPKVSVCIITYNHVDYIEQALLSALTQRTNFEFEVIVSDDASTDGTAAVIRRVASRYPKLRTILHNKNLGGMGQENYLTVHNAARGEFVAHLDGDDFWLPGKLQKQLSVLERHPECAVAWHPMIAFDEAGHHHIIGDHGDLVRKLFGKDVVELGDAMVAYGVTGFHSSCMYRRSARTLHSYPLDRVLLDYRLSLSLLERGAGYHMKQPLGCYRAFHDDSATRGGRDLVGPGLFGALTDYSQSHAHLRPLIAAHCVASFVSRSRFQTRLVKLLLSRIRTAARREQKLATEPATVRRKISLKGHVFGQWRYSLNSLRLLRLGLEQKRLPGPQSIVRALRVASYLGRSKVSKSRFPSRKYGQAAKG